MRAGDEAYRRGDHSEAEKHSKAQLEFEVNMASNRSLDNLAMLYQDQGKYAEAEPLHVRAGDPGKCPWPEAPRLGGEPEKLRRAPPEDGTRRRGREDGRPCSGDPEAEITACACSTCDMDAAVVVVYSVCHPPLIIDIAPSWRPSMTANSHYSRYIAVRYHSLIHHLLPRREGG